MTILLIIIVLHQESRRASTTCQLNIDTTNFNPISTIFDSEPMGDKNIFFLETFGVIDKQVHLTARTACAIKAAAIANPGWNVYVTFFNGFNYKEQAVIEMIQLLRKYSNIHMAAPWVGSFFQGSKLKQDWAVDRNYITEQANILSHMGRLFLLNKYSGIYMDLDFIAINTFDKLGSNFAVAETHSKVSSSFINFASDDVGRLMVKKLWNELTPKDVDVTTEYLLQSDELFTQIFQQECGVTHAFNMTTQHCHGIKTIPSWDVMPVNYENRLCIFQETCLEEGLRLVNAAFAVRLWGSETSKTLVSIYQESLLNYLGTRSCPRIFSTIQEVW